MHIPWGGKMLQHTGHASNICWFFFVSINSMELRIMQIWMNFTFTYMIIMMKSYLEFERKTTRLLQECKYHQIQCHLKRLHKWAHQIRFGTKVHQISLICLTHEVVSSRFSKLESIMVVSCWYAHKRSDWIEITIQCTN